MSTPLNPLNTPQHAAIYRPKYRTRTDNPQYELEGVNVAVATQPGLLHSLDALEAWCRREQAHKQKHAPHWRPEKALALKLYIPGKWVSLYSSKMLRAAHSWAAASNGLIHITLTTSAHAADICFAVQEATTHGRDYEVGHTDTVVEGQWITQAIITLINHPKIDQTLDHHQIQDRLYCTLLHELGHALGLTHSEHKADVMHHRGWRNNRLSQNDTRQIQTLYETVAQLEAIV